MPPFFRPLSASSGIGRPPSVKGVGGGVSAAPLGQSINPLRQSPINAPLFDKVPKAPHEGKIGKAKWQESINPEGFSPSGSGNLTGGNLKHYPDAAPFPAPIQDSDFPGDGVFTRGTDSNFEVR